MHCIRSCLFLLSQAMWLLAMVAAGAKPCRTMQLGLPFAYCPGWETIKAAAVLATVVAAKYKRNKKLSYCWETVRCESMPRIAEMDVEMTT